MKKSDGISISKDGKRIRLTGNAAKKTGNGFATSVPAPKIGNNGIGSLNFRKQDKVSNVAFQPIEQPRLAVSVDSKEFKTHLEASEYFAQSLEDFELEAIKHYANNEYKNFSTEDYISPYGIKNTDVKMLLSAIEKAPVLNKPRILYRGLVIHNNNGIPIHKSLDEKIANFLETNFPLNGNFARRIPTSTSIDPIVAVEGFAEKLAKTDDGVGVIIEYSTRFGVPLSNESHTGLGYSDDDDELEVLLPPNQKYRVMAIHKNQDYKVKVIKERFKSFLPVSTVDNVRSYKVVVIQVVDAD